MTKLDTAAFDKATTDLRAVLPENVVIGQSKADSPAASKAAQPAGKRRGPSALMQSGWAMGGSAA